MAEKEHPYRDMINQSRPPLPHNRPPMSLHDRGAQFAPFSPLTGHNSTLDQVNQRHIQSLEERRVGLTIEGDVEED